MVDFNHPNNQSILEVESFVLLEEVTLLVVVSY